MRGTWRAVLPRGVRALPPQRAAFSTTPVRLRVVTRKEQLDRQRPDDAFVVQKKPFLFPVGGKVLSFESEPSKRDPNDPQAFLPGAVYKASGWEHGDKVRAMSGRYVGQIAVVIGLRGGALWLHFTGQPDPEGIWLQDLPHLDLRLVGRAALTGMDAMKFRDGDPVPGYHQYTTAEMKEKSKVPFLLDEASLQHIVNERGYYGPCERCKERVGNRKLVQAVKALQLPVLTEKRVLRWLTHGTYMHRMLNTPEALLQELADRKKESTEDAASLLAKLFEERSRDYDSLATVRLTYGGDYLIPRGALEPIATGETTRTLLIKPAYKKKYPFDEEGTEAPPLQLSDANLSSIIKELRNLEHDSLHAALLSAGLELSTCKRIEAILVKRDPDYMKDLVKLYEMLTVGDEARGPARLRTALNLRGYKEVSFPEGIFLLPTEAIDDRTYTEVKVLEGHWVTELLNSHPSLPKSENYILALGRRGRMVPGGQDARRLNYEQIATSLLEELGTFTSRHDEPSVPLAEVYVHDEKAQYSYLDKACAVELYGACREEELPPMFLCGGYPNYAYNGYHQPLGLTSSISLGGFTHPESRSRARNRSLIYKPHETP